jgi:hypothetical protein
LRPQPAGVGIECWKLDPDGAFVRCPEPLREDETWPPPPMEWGTIGEVEDLGPVAPLT